MRCTTTCFPSLSAVHDTAASVSPFRCLVSIMSRACFAAVLLLSLAGQAYCRVPSSHSAASNDACGTCKVAVHIFSDMMCDAYVDDTLAKWVVDNICSNFDEKEQCADLVVGLAPALVQWLRVNADPDTLCADAGVCPAAALQAQVQRTRHTSSRPNDIACPLCMYVAGKLKEQVNNPVTQADIRDASLAACAAMPEGVMRDACNTFVEQYGEQQHRQQFFQTKVDATLAYKGIHHGNHQRPLSKHRYYTWQSQQLHSVGACM
eukprot:GHRQ01026499.1.p1 GENE.GHRQ01026499.1~~GHRQ01026499.1.p1  ORF type:complete len:263 (-),score=75.17 GHRQ01026499.1:920-1708(-)